jgi:hypothetical protein
LPTSLLVLAVSCGGRSGLGVASSASSGEGGAASASSSSSSGSGGDPAQLCGTSVEKFMLTIEDGTDLTQPSLVALNTTPPTVALVYSRKPLAPGAAATASVASFAGWDAWPPPAPTIVAMTDPSAGNAAVPGVGLLASTRRAAGPASFALLHSDGAGLFTRLSLLAESTGSIGKSGVPRPGTPLMLAADPASDNFFFSGFVAHDGGSFALHLQDGTDEWTNSYPTFGCASTPIVADVAGLGTGAQNGWLVAAALGTGINLDPPSNITPSCADKFAAIGPATALTIAQISPAGLGTANQVIEMEDTNITQIRMAPRAGGAWVTWSIEGRAALLTATLRPNLVVDELFAINPFNDGDVATASFDIKPLKNLQEIAMTVRSPIDGDRLQFMQIPSIGYVGGSGVDLSAEGRVDGPVSLLISEVADIALIAWSELPAGASAHRLRVAKIRCISTP